MDGFKAWLIERSSVGGRGRFADVAWQDMDDGDVLIKVCYASINRRDALSSSGGVPAVRRYPCIGGMDLAGVVVRSASPRFTPGARVLSSGYGLGLAHHGGYAEYALLPGGWVQDAPESLSLCECMILGSAGLAAGLAICRLEDNGLKPEMGPVLVSGATGSIGSLASAMLAARGYQVWAATRRPGHTGWLAGFGVHRVIGYGDLGLTATEPLGKGFWAGAIDNLGGSVLEAILRTLKPGGSVVSVGDGLAEGLRGTMQPFVARGVALLGIDATQAGFALRERVWSRLEGDLRPQGLTQLAKVVAFGELPETFEQLLAGHLRGRTVVRIAQDGCEKESS